MKRDFTYFMPLRVFAGIGRSLSGIRPAEQVMPSVSQPVAAIVAVINHLLASSLADRRN